MVKMESQKPKRKGPSVVVKNRFAFLRPIFKPNQDGDNSFLSSRCAVKSSSEYFSHVGLYDIVSDVTLVHEQVIQRL